MNYLEWNDAIGARFFNPERSDARVILYVTTEIINEIGAPYASDRTDFIAAVKTGPPWITRHKQSICQQALQAFDKWRDRSQYSTLIHLKTQTLREFQAFDKWLNRNPRYPPYIAYLALFVLANTIEVPGFSRYSYYPGLRDLLGERPETGAYPSFDKMYALWFDLEGWSNGDMNGLYGVFRADILGKREYVGLPRAQTILTDDERAKLPILLAEGSFDPSSPPTDRELADIFSKETHGYLLPRTKSLLETSGGSEQTIRKVLMDAIIEELLHWDGSLPPQPELGEGNRRSLGNLRLVMILDLTSRTARFYLRCSSICEYPEEGLQLTGDRTPEPLYCLEDWQGWSTPLYLGENMSKIFDASTLDWSNGLSLEDEEQAWKVALPKRSLRVMTNATPLGFEGYVEESQIPTRKSFFLLAHDIHSQMLHRWGVQCCDGFVQKDLNSGLPDRWSLYFVNRVHSGAVTRETYPLVPFPVAIRIQLRGGLKVKGNQYFVFALPYVEVTGSTDKTAIYCNDHLLSVDEDTGLYVLPDTLDVNKLVIEAKQDGECIRRRSLYVVEDYGLPKGVPGIRLNMFGSDGEDSTSEACVGPIISGFTPPDFHPEILLPPSASHLVYLIGRNPGEIVKYPDKTIPDGWKPVWAVWKKKRRKGTVYCGMDLENDVPGTAQCTDRRRLRLWKEVLWFRRKQIPVPSQKRIRSLWIEFRKVAHRVR